MPFTSSGQSFALLGSSFAQNSARQPWSAPDPQGSRVVEGPPLARPKFDTIVDTFDSADTATWTFSADTSVTGGQLLLTPPVTTAFIQTNETHDLTGSAISLEMVQAYDGSGGAITIYLLPDSSFTHAALFFLSSGSGNLRFQQRVLGADTDVVTAVAYNATTHRFLRWAEVGGAIAWQTSPDGSTWTTQATWTPPWPLDSLLVRFQSSSAGGTTSTIVDNVNVVPTTTLTVTPDLASSAATAFDLTVSTTLTVVPDLTTATPAAFSPTVSLPLTVTPGVATSAPQAFAPTVSTPLTVAPGLASATAAALAPAVSTSLTATPGPASSTAQAFAPDVTTTVTATPGLASSTATAFAPVVTVAGGPVTVVPDRADSTAQAFAPSVALPVTASPGLASSTPTAYAPTVTAALTVTPDPAASAAVAYDPAVSLPGSRRTMTVSPGRGRTLAAAGTTRTLAATGTGTRVLTAAGRGRELAAVGASRTLTATPED